MRGLNMMNQNRWQTLMSAMGLPPSKECYDALHAAYSEKRRFYHTVDHIDAMLTHVDGVKDIAERPEELELAIWFHDAIYKPLSKTNELDSANWAQAFLASHGYGEAGIARVHNLIMAMLHNGSVKSHDAQLIVDIDLAILGALPAVYDQFERNVRRNTGWCRGLSTARSGRTCFSRFSVVPVFTTLIRSRKNTRAPRDITSAEPSICSRVNGGVLAGSAAGPGASS